MTTNTYHSVNESRRSFGNASDAHWLGDAHRHQCKITPTTYTIPFVFSSIFAQSLRHFSSPGWRCISFLSRSIRRVRGEKLYSTRTLVRSLSPIAIFMSTRLIRSKVYVRPRTGPTGAAHGTSGTNSP